MPDATPVALDDAPAPTDTPTGAASDATAAAESTAVLEPVVALTSSDTMLHVGPAAEVLSHLEGEGGSLPVDAATWHFFGRDATRLIQHTDPTSSTVTLVVDAAADAPDDLARQLLLDRIDAFLARAQVRLTRDLRTEQKVPSRRVPRVTGELHDVVTALAAVLSAQETISEPNSKNWLHNLGHRLGL